MYAEVLTTIEADNFQPALDCLTTQCILLVGPSCTASNLHISNCMLPRLLLLKTLVLFLTAIFPSCSQIQDKPAIEFWYSMHLCLITSLSFTLSLPELTVPMQGLRFAWICLCCKFSSPYKLGDITCTEKVQQKFTKHLCGLKNSTYCERLAQSTWAEPYLALSNFSPTQGFDFAYWKIVKFIFQD